MNNALAKFNIHISEVEPKEPLNSFSAEHVGRALHFLQDITQPQHTQRGNFMQNCLIEDCTERLKILKRKT